MKTKILILLLITLFNYSCNGQQKKTPVTEDIPAKTSKRIKEEKPTFFYYEIDNKKESLSLHNTGAKHKNYKTHITLKQKQMETINFALQLPSSSNFLVKDGRQIKNTKLSKQKKQNGYISQNRGNQIKVNHYDDFKKINTKDQRFIAETGLLLVNKNKVQTKELNKYKEKHVLSGIGITNQNQIVILVSKSKLSYLDFAKVFQEDYHCISATILQTDVVSFYDSKTKKFVGEGISKPIFIVSEKSKKTIDDTKPRSDDGVVVIQPKPEIVKQIQTKAFKGKKYIVCKVGPSNKLILSNPLGIKNNQQKFNEVNKQITDLKKTQIFAMNAGMYDEKQVPIGLYVENGVQKHELNIRKGTYGNFYTLPPNGVFFVNKKGKAQVVTTNEFLQKYTASKPQIATQSGPMMVINGAFNKAFNEGSPNLNIRNGIGVNKKGETYMVISKEPVNFYEFSELFRDVLKCDNALYLDGVVSQYYAPGVNVKINNNLPIGPIISIVNK